MILAVTGIVGVAYYSDQEVVVNPVNQVLTFTPEIQCNVAGDCIQFNIPVVPENENKLPNETVPVNYDIEDVSDNIYNENGTEIEPTKETLINLINSNLITNK